MSSAMRLVVDDLGLQRLGEELVAVAAAALGPVERDVGIDQQALRIGDGIQCRWQCRS